MKKVWLTLMAALLMVTLSIPAFASEGRQNRGDLALISGEMTLDGKKDEAYAKGQSLSLNLKVVDAGGFTKEEIGKAWLIAQKGDTTDYIWCYTEITDAAIQAGEGEFYARDSVELFLNFKNSDEASDTIQYIIDALGNAKAWQPDYVENRVDLAVEGERDKVVEIGSYFQCAVTGTDTGYSVEYRVPVNGKLENGAKIAYSMIVHNLPEWGMYYCETSDDAPANWGVSTYDYFTVKAEAETTTAETDAPVDSGEEEDTGELPPTTADPAWTFGILAATSAAACAAGLVISNKKKH